MVVCIVFLLCFMIIRVFFRLCIFFSELIKWLLLCWWSLIDGLFNMYMILDKLELIWVVNWICWVFFLERVCVDWERVKYLIFMFCIKVSWLRIFFRIGWVIFWFCLDKWICWKKLIFLEIGSFEIWLMFWFVIFIVKVCLLSW